MKKRSTIAILTVIMVVAAFLRLFRIESSQQFLGDQGRDALLVAKIFHDLDPVFIGPVTSIGNLYLGPLYYYFMVPWLWLTYPNPIGPSIAVACIGIVTVYFMYRLGKQIIGPEPALLATGLYALAAVVIQLTRFSWNPNPAPLIGLLVIYSLHQACQGKSRHWLWLSLWSVILLQLHYMYLLALVSVGIVWLYLVKQSRNIHQRWQLMKHAAIVLIALIISTTPLVLFDIKHDGLNARAFYKLLFTKDGIYHQNSRGVVDYLIEVLLEIHGRSLNILTELFLGQHRTINTLILIAIIFFAYRWLKRQQQKSYKLGFSIVLTMIVTGIIGTSFYGHSVFSHYIAYLFPAVFLLFGVVLVSAWQWHLVGKLLAVSFISWFLWFNIPRLPIAAAGWQIKDMRTVAESVAQRVSAEEKYNIVLFSETGDLDGMNYRYFLYTLGKPPVEKEESGDVQTLVVINEGSWKQPVTDSPVWDIVTFPNKQPSEVYQIPGGPEITIFRRQSELNIAK